MQLATYIYVAIITVLAILSDRLDKKHVYIYSSYNNYYSYTYLDV